MGKGIKTPVSLSFLMEEKYPTNPPSTPNVIENGFENNEGENQDKEYHFRINHRKE
jgi:hypothetical protein